MAIEGISWDEKSNKSQATGDYEGIHDVLVSELKMLIGTLEPVKLSKPIYLVHEGTRKAHPIPWGHEGLLLIANHLKYAMGKYDLPDELLLITASWFLTHLNLIQKEPYFPPSFNKSIIVYTQSPQVTMAVKKLYWVLRDLYFPHQSCGENGITKYNSVEALFDSHVGWKKFHIVGLTELLAEDFNKIARAVSQQSNSLFTDRWPLILLASPSQPKLQKVLFNITI